MTRMTTPEELLSKGFACVITNQHWRAFCDAWLAIGLAATLCSATRYTPKALGAYIGRVRYQPLPKDRGA